MYIFPQKRNTNINKKKGENVQGQQVYQTIEEICKCGNNAKNNQ